MDWLNYHHLYYFWVVAKEGSIRAASEQLRLAQPTISAQLQALESYLGVQLFTRGGRRLFLTDAGRQVFSRAEEIFSLGRDLVNFVKDHQLTRPAPRLNVGVADALPRLVVYRLLEPLLRLKEQVVPVCFHGKHTDLLAKLSVYELDLVLTDATIGSQVKIKAFNHLLGECGIAIFATSELAATYARDFPRSLDKAPFLLPTSNTSLRRLLNSWFAEQRLRPSIVGEFEDSALLKSFGQAGVGLFAMPAVEESEVKQLYGVQCLGYLDGLHQRFYAISAERRLKHPHVLAITENAHKRFHPGE